jgi:SAM-dependent methyltransferase
VLDFGCGDGQLSLFLAKEKHPRRILGVDIHAPAIERAKAALAKIDIPEGTSVDFVVGATDSLPVPDHSFDTVLAFDCLEHVMSPDEILRDWSRVLRPGGRCLIEWYPYSGPWGPHMEALIPIPCAHVIFGERAMFRTAEKIYDLPDFVPRHWDLDNEGNKRPNKWRAWSSFEEQGYINKLELSRFRDMVLETTFKIARLEVHSFGGSRLRRAVGHALMNMPVMGKYFIMYAIVELLVPGDIDVM